MMNKVQSTTNPSTLAKSPSKEVEYEDPEVVIALLEEQLQSEKEG